MFSSLLTADSPAAGLPTVAIISAVGVLLAVILLVWFIATYNRLVRRRNQVQASWAQIDVQLKRRHDLIPNLVETVRGYAAHEATTLEAVIRARGSAVATAGADPAARAEAESALTSALGRLLALSEAYPTLQANANFRELQAELSNTEDKIAYARQFYNAAVQSFNDTSQTFPTNLMAGMTGMRPRPFFASSDDERGPVRVRF